MAILILENLPDELMEQIQQLARQQNQSVDQQVIYILEQALSKQQKPLKFLISPETDSTWEERQKATPKILAEIEGRRKKRRTDIQ
jgi:plasmid stability protein